MPDVMTARKCDTCESHSTLYKIQTIAGPVLLCCAKCVTTPRPQRLGTLLAHSATDLLAALKVIVDAMDRWDNSNEMVDMFPARAAIAKAEGR